MADYTHFIPQEESYPWRGFDISQSFNTDDEIKFDDNGDTRVGKFKWASHVLRTSPNFSINSESDEFEIYAHIDFDGSYTDWYPTVRIAGYFENGYIHFACRGVNASGNTFDATYRVTRTRTAYSFTYSGNLSGTQNNVEDSFSTGIYPADISGMGVNTYDRLSGSSVTGNCVIDTDIPIFATYNDYNNYVLSGGTDFTGCLNIGGNDYEEGVTQLYHVYCKRSNANVFYGNVTPTGSPSWRSMRFYANKPPVFVMTEANSFAMVLQASKVVSSIGVSGEPYYIDYVPESQWREGELYYTDGFYADIDRYKKCFHNIPTNSSYYLALSLDTNIYVFSNQEDADDYLDNPEDEDAQQKAINYEQVSQYKELVNPTGQPINNIEMGQVYTRGFFSRQYILNQTGMAEVSNALFSTGVGSLWDAIKQGVEAYGDSPIESVQSCMYFPVDLTQVFSGGIGATNSVFFGSYQLTLENATVYQILFPNGHYDLGQVTIRRKTNTWRDYAPYTRCYVYLPYCGTFELDLARYYGKTVTIRYYIDTRTGGCLCCLLANGGDGVKLIDYFNGQMGVQMPITLTDFGRYANQQIQTLLGGIQGEKPILNNGINMAEMLINNNTAGTGMGLVAGASLIATGVNAGKTVYDLTQNNINSFNKTVGGSSSMLNEYLPQRVTFIFEYQESMEVEYEKMLQGLPSNSSGLLSSFSGYLECESVNLVCGTATANEKAQIVQALKNGVIL